MHSEDLQMRAAVDSARCTMIAPPTANRRPNRNPLTDLSRAIGTNLTNLAGELMPDDNGQLHVRVPAAEDSDVGTADTCPAYPYLDLTPAGIGEIHLHFSQP
jgi:hypothetical protein